MVRTVDIILFTIVHCGINQRTAYVEQTVRRDKSVRTVFGTKPFICFQIAPSRKPEFV